MAEDMQQCVEPMIDNMRQSVELVDGRGQKHQFTIVVNVEKLAKAVGHKAMQNGAGVTKLAGGAVEVRYVKSS